MTLQQLKYYCSVCECGSITKAAKKSYVTQPAVTAAIRELEKEYAVRLVNKEGKRICLTGEGEDFYYYASQMLEMARKFDSQIRDRLNRSRKLRIGITKSAGSSVYMEYFSKNGKEYQDLELQLTVDSSSVLLEQLRERELDVILILDHGVDRMEDLERVVLKKTEMWYCFSQTHSLASEPQICVSMVAGEKMVSTKKDDYKQEALKELFAAAGCGKEPQVVWRFDQLDTALRMVEANLGTGYFPAESIRKYQGIAGRKLEEDQAVPVCVVWSKESWMREEVQHFVKGIRKFYQNYL